MNRPTEKDHRSTVNFIENDADMLAAGDDEFVYLKDDLVTLRTGREHAWLDDAVERMIQVVKFKPVQVRQRRSCQKHHVS